MNRYLIAVGLAGFIPIFLPSFAQAASAQLMAGDPRGRNVAFVFDREGDSGLRIETRQVGNPGARLSIWIDHSKKRLFSRVLTMDDCKFGDGGARGQIEISKNSPAFAQFVTAFSRGTTAHVEVQNAAVMQMRSDVSLNSFAQQLRS